MISSLTIQVSAKSNYHSQYQYLSDSYYVKYRMLNAVLNGYTFYSKKNSVYQ
jgi:hypothetical protein